MERIKRPDLLAEIKNVITDFERRKKGREIPTVVIPSFGPRSEGKEENLFDELRAVSGFLQKKDASAAFVWPTSPHTLAAASKDAMIDAMQKVLKGEIKLPKWAEQAEKLPGQLFIWWFRNEDDGQMVRMDLLSLSQLSDRDRTPFVKVIVKQTERAVRILKEVFNISSRNIHEVLDIYGLFGHSQIDERKLTGLSRGAQSNKHGHMAVTYFPKDLEGSVKLEEVSVDDELKQIGPWDTVLFERFRVEISHIIMNIVSKRLGEEAQFEVADMQDYARQSDGRRMPFCELFRVNFREEIDLDLALLVLLDIVSGFSLFYAKLAEFYEDYYKNIGEKDNFVKMKEKITQKAQEFGFSPQKAGELAGDGFVYQTNSCPNRQVDS